MKYIASGLIAISLSLAGYSASRCLEVRIAKLEKISVLLSDIKSRIEFTADCVTDIFCALNKSENYITLPFIKECADRLASGDSFDFVWRKALAQKENISGLKKEDIDVLLSFGASFGTTDVTGQLSNCEIHTKLIETKILSARKDYSLYSKPAKGIGVLAGVAVIILSL